MTADPSLKDCRRLFLRGHTALLNIGVHDFEKRGPQRVLINVDVYVPLTLSTPQHDDIVEVVDYDFIRRSIAEQISGGHVHLQETLADGLLARMLAHPQVLAARVSTEKPDVYGDGASVGVEVFGIKKEPAR